MRTITWLFGHEFRYNSSTAAGASLKRRTRCKYFFLQRKFNIAMLLYFWSFEAIAKGIFENWFQGGEEYSRHISIYFQSSFFSICFLQIFPHPVMPSPIDASIMDHKYSSSCVPHTCLPQFPFVREWKGTLELATWTVTFFIHCTLRTTTVSILSPHTVIRTCIVASFTGDL